MYDPFQRANQVGLNYVREWLPDGKLENHEWVAINPTRHDTRYGSFKINLNTGVWSDFADGVGGPDAVSLYAYLNRQECERLAREKGYRNIEGGAQLEAARLILEKYDSSYFPSPKDVFKLPKQNQNPWSGFSCIESGLTDPPALDLSWYEQMWGSVVEKWDLFSESLNIVMKIVRFQKEGDKKNDRPFTLWKKNSEIKWRSKALPGQYPLWGFPDLLTHAKRPVLLTEGQKTASRAKSVLGDKYVCCGWYGGSNAVKKTDWKPLSKRQVYFWPDADLPGKKTIPVIKKYIKNIKIVYPPGGVTEGWDIADAIQEGWTVEKLIEHIDQPEPEYKNVFIEDNPFPFKIVGIQGHDIVFFQYKSRRILKYRINALTKNCLMTLVDREMWKEFYMKGEEGIHWDAAINDILRTAEESPLFDNSRIRGSGAWMDKDRIVINTGEFLLVDGSRVNDKDFKTDYIYEKNKFIPYGQQTPLVTNEAKKLIDIVDLVPFSNEICKKIMIGWIVLAPWCGLLKWRPHVWLTGSKGSGKTWIINEILSPFFFQFGIRAKGSSTPAGIRNSLANCPIPIIMDEMESDNSKYGELIEQNLKIFREASSGDGISTLHGTTDGEGRQWIVSTMVFLASIGVDIKHGADLDRFTILQLKKKNKDSDFRKLRKMVEILTPLWCESFHSRTYTLLRELIKCIEVMVTHMVDVIGSRRDADQVGTLLAGYWMCVHDKAATAAEAVDFLKTIDVVSVNEVKEQKPDEELCLDEILSAVIDITDGAIRNRVTVAKALLYRFNENENSFPGATINGVKLALEQRGLKPIDDGGHWLCIACSHPGMKKLLNNTKWNQSYIDFLRRLDFCAPDMYGPGRFAGVRKRFIKIDLADVLEDIPF